jgi:hypothetical protein
LETYLGVVPNRVMRASLSVYAYLEPRPFEDNHKADWDLFVFDASQRLDFDVGSWPGDRGVSTDVLTWVRFVCWMHRCFGHQIVTPPLDPFVLFPWPPWQWAVPH